MSEDNTYTDDTEYELARAMAEVQFRHSEAAEQIAMGSVDRADYELFKALQALGNYLFETTDWSVDAGTERASDD